LKHNFHIATDSDPVMNPRIGATIEIHSGSDGLELVGKASALVDGATDKLPREALKASSDEFELVKGINPICGGRPWTLTQ